MPTRSRKSSPLDAQIPLACSSEPDAVLFLEAQRGWIADADATCPKCGVIGESRRMKAKDGSRNARFLWKCTAAKCKAQFTVKVGTVMEDSPIPARHWVLALYRAASSKKGISALQLSSETQLSYKSALFLLHRIRWAMAPANEQESKLSGVVEFDETYIGGKPRYPARKNIRTGKKGKAKDFDRRKTAVLGGVERDGRVKVRVVRNLRATDIADHVRDMVDPSATLNTDESKVYNIVGREFEGGHYKVKHALGQYARYTMDGEQVTTNRIEGFWANMKRQINGTHHAVSRKHLHRYVSEVEFKYNNRNLSDADRMVKLIRSCDQRRLTYAEQVSNQDPTTGRFIYGAKAGKAQW